MLILQKNKYFQSKNRVFKAKSRHGYAGTYIKVHQLFSSIHIHSLLFISLYSRSPLGPGFHVDGQIKKYAKCIFISVDLFYTPNLKKADSFRCKRF